MADVVIKRLETIDKEVEDKEVKLEATVEGLLKNPGETTLLAERNRLVEAVANLNARRKNLEDKLPGSAAGLGVESTTGSGSAAGLGLGRAARAACKLRLQQDSQNPDLFFLEPMDTTSAAAAASPGVHSRFFLDPEGRQTDELWDWLGRTEDSYHEGEPILPLIINGQMKSGKSYMLNEVLPAVANTYYCSGGSGRQHAGAVLSEPNFLRVNCFSCDRSSGSGGFLMDFLIKLKRSAANQQLSAAASMPVPSNCSAGAMVVAIRDFMRRLPRDRLNFLLIDEAQSFYLLERPWSERPRSDNCPPRGSILDVNAVLHMRRILKELLLDSPPWVAWAVTGSTMATVWANIAATPTMRYRQLNLSPTVSMGVLQVAWEQLKAQAATWDPALPNDLFWRSPPQIATLAYLCRRWRYSRMASTAAELVEQDMTHKLIPEVLVDLRMVLQVMGQPAAQLRLLRELLDPMAGVERDKLPVAFEVLLGSFATEREGRLYLDYPLLAQVLQAGATESGELLDSMDAVHWISSAKFRELLTLGERCKDSEHFDSYVDLHSLLEDMASALALTPDELLEADWFIHVLDHPRNSLSAKANFERNHQAQARQDVKVGLRWFHGLLHNVLSHGTISEQRQALQVYPSKLTEFYSSGRISEALTKTYDIPMPRRSKPPGGPGPVRPISLHLGKRPGRAAIIQPPYMGRAEQGAAAGGAPVASFEQGAAAGGAPMASFEQGAAAGGAPVASFEQGAAAMGRLLREGKIRAWGVSNETSWGVVRHCAAADAAGLPRPATIQNSYSLLHRTFEGDRAKVCAPHHLNLGMPPWSALAGGALTGKYLPHGTRPEGCRSTLFPERYARFITPRVAAAVTEYVRITREAGVTPAQLGYAWCRSRWFIPSVLVGAASIAQLAENLGA